jgi:acetyltransferase-like isoleucine patch superfamily enzyme
MHSLIHETAKVGENFTCGNFVTIDEGAVIGDGCILGNCVSIHAGSVIGDSVRIDDGAVIGKLPMRAANSAVTKDMELEPTKIGSGCIIGTNAVIYRGCTLGDKVLAADQATVRENVVIGEGVIIGRGVAVENRCTVGAYTKLETNVYITAYSEIGERCFVAPCVATSNDNYAGRTEKRFSAYKGVVLERGARVGVNATILPGKTIGADSLIAAGAVVTKDTEAAKIYAGNPAKYFRDVPEEELLDNQKGMKK